MMNSMEHVWHIVGAQEMLVGPQNLNYWLTFIN